MDGHSPQKYVGLSLNIDTGEMAMPPADWREANPDAEVYEVEITIDGQTRQLTFEEFKRLIFPWFYSDKLIEAMGEVKASEEIAP